MKTITSTGLLILQSCKKTEKFAPFLCSFECLHSSDSCSTFTFSVPWSSISFSRPSVVWSFCFPVVSPVFNVGLAAQRECIRCMQEKPHCFLFTKKNEKIKEIFMDCSVDPNSHSSSYCWVLLFVLPSLLKEQNLCKMCYLFWWSQPQMKV